MNKYLLLAAFIAYITSGISSYAHANNSELQKAKKQVAQGQLNQAKATLQKLIQQYPEAPEPYNNLAVIEAQQGNTQAAKLLLEKALRTSSGHQTSYENLHSLNQHEALNAYKKSLALKTKQQPIQLSYMDNLSTHSIPEVKVVEKPVEVIREVEVIKEVERIVKVQTECPTLPAQSNTECPSQNQQSSSYPDPEQHVRTWAKAWSAKDINTYVASYTRDYSHAPNRSHVDWVTLRRQRLAKPKYIRVQLSQLSTQRLSDTSASISFLQSYQSDTINDTIHKMLVLVIEEGEWKIKQEVVLR